VLAEYVLQAFDVLVISRNPDTWRICQPSAVFSTPINLTRLLSLKLWSTHLKTHIASSNPDVWIAHCYHCMPFLTLITAQSTTDSKPHSTCTTLFLPPKYPLDLCVSVSLSKFVQKSCRIPFYNYDNWCFSGLLGTSSNVHTLNFPHFGLLCNIYQYYNSGMKVVYKRLYRSIQCELCICNPYTACE